MRKIYCLADAHLGETVNSYDDFYNALNEIKKEEVFYFIVLGDLFKFFIGIKKWVEKKQLDVLEKIYELRKEGACTILIEGNRDFFLEEKVLGKYFDIIEREVFINFEGKNFLFLHGDKVNLKDKKYLFWNKFSKSSFLYFITKRFPKPLLLPFYLFLEKSLKNTNFKFREKIPLEDIENFARSQNDKVDYIVLGHFHKEFKTKVGKKEIFCLPAFRDTKKIWFFENGN